MNLLGGVVVVVVLFLESAKGYSDGTMNDPALVKSSQHHDSVSSRAPIAKSWNNDSLSHTNMHVHGSSLHSFLLFDQVELSRKRGSSYYGWDATGWVGGDLTRVWLRSEGAITGKQIESAKLEVLYGKSVLRWWDIVSGVRTDLRSSSANTWAAIGIQGIAPYFIELEATAYIGSGWRTMFSLSAEYETLISNRLILSSAYSLDVYGRSDIKRQAGAGLSTSEFGWRVRYELNRQFAPYVGIRWEKNHGETARMRTAEHSGAAGGMWTAGVRTWF